MYIIKLFCAKKYKHKDRLNLEKFAQTRNCIVNGNAPQNRDGFYIQVATANKFKCIIDLTERT